MSIKRNKKVTIKLAISQEELDEIVKLVCRDLSGNIEDINRYEEYDLNGIEIIRTVNVSDNRLYSLSVCLQTEHDILDLESSIISSITQLHVNSYNQSIEQEKQIRQDQRDGY